MDNSQAYCALKRLTEHFRITKREVIEELVIILDKDVSERSKRYPSGHDEDFSSRMTFVTA